MGLILFLLSLEDIAQSWRCRDSQVATAAHHQDIMLKVAQAVPLRHFRHQLLVLEESLYGGNIVNLGKYCVLKNGIIL